MAIPDKVFYEFKGATEARLAGIEADVSHVRQDIAKLLFERTENRSGWRGGMRRDAAMAGGGGALVALVEIIRYFVG